ncbi:hypothetical protein ABFS82_14G016600 [Erythranthe guttata]
MVKKKEDDQNDKEMIRAHHESVLDLLNKQAPLSPKQEKFCNEACVERYLKAKGYSVKKAAKNLRNCLSWRDSFGTDKLMADEFCGELAEGVAYVAGHDDESRPVVILRIKHDYQKFHSHKLFTRLLVFTLEVAIQTMAKNVQQFVLLFDAGFFRSASAFMNMLLATLKIISDYYPQMLHKAFVIDPPSLFSYLWKGVKPFVELSSSTSVVSSFDFQDSLRFSDMMTTSTSSRFNASSQIESCYSSRFSFTVSNNFDSLKPWYLSLSNTSKSKLCQTNPFSSPSISSTSTPNATSSSSSLAPRTPRGNIDAVCKKGIFFPSTPRTPNPTSSFFQSPAFFFRKERQTNRVEKSRDLFLPFLKFYQRPYDEMVYRSKMRAPLGGLVSIVSPQIKRRHVSLSQRF